MFLRSDQQDNISKRRSNSQIEDKGLITVSPHYALPYNKTKVSAKLLQAEFLSPQKKTL